MTESETHSLTDEDDDDTNNNNNNNNNITPTPFSVRRRVVARKMASACGCTIRFGS